MFGTLGDEHFDLLLGDGRFVVRFAGEEEQDGAGGKSEDGDDRRAEPGEGAHGLGYKGGDRFGIGEGDVLGNEFAEDQREIGDGEDDDGDGDGFTVLVEDRDGIQVGTELLRQRGSAESPGEGADHGDADLNRGEKVVWIFGECKGHRRAFAAIAGALAEPGFARRDDGHLRHGKEAVGQNQEKEERDFERSGAHVDEALFCQ